MNLVFIGASKFGLRCLGLVCEIESVQVVGVVTAPQTFSISYRPEGVQNVLHADVYGCARAKGLSVAMLDKGMKDPSLNGVVRSWKPDMFMVAGWYHMIPKEWRKLAPAYGLHASLLPDYSGGAPLVWAMINGERKTGISLFQMDDSVDSGPIVGQAEEPIYETDTIGSLYSRIEDRGLELLARHLPLLASGQASLHTQNHALRRVFPQRSPEDGRINWGKSAAEIDRFIRAQTRPYPGAFTTLNGKKLTVWEARPAHGACTIKLGHVVREGNTYCVGCGSGKLILSNVSYTDKDYKQSMLDELFAEGNLQFETGHKNMQSTGSV